MKKKQSVVLSTLIFIMIFLCFVYFALQKINLEQAEKAQQNGESLELYSVDTEAAVKFKLTNANGEMAFIREDSIWYHETDKNFPVDQTKITDLLSQLALVSANREVAKESSDLAQYGLDQPSLVLYLETKDGVSAEISLGNEAPANGGYYAQVDGGSAVYTMDISYYETAAAYRENDFMKVESGPVFDEAAVSYFLAKRSNGSYFEAAEDESSVFWVRGAYKTPVRGDAGQLETLFLGYSGISYGDVVTYHCTDATQYGIDKNGAKISLRYLQETEAAADDGSGLQNGGLQEGSLQDGNEEDSGTGEDSAETKSEEKEYTLYIGNLGENGKYYVQPKGSSYIYQMDAELVEGYLNVDAFSCADHSVVTETVDLLKQVQITAGGKTYRFKLTEKTGDDDTEITYIVKKDGKRTDTQSFLSALAELQSLTYVKEAEEEREGEAHAKNVSDKAETNIVLKTKNGKKSIEFLPYDGNNYYRVSVDGEAYFLAEKKSADKIISGFISLE